MTHTYSQTTGTWTEPGGQTWNGYSGHGDGLDNPAMQDVHNVGPVPRGEWRIGQALNHPHLGPVAMPLLFVANDDGGILVPGGRFGFFVHGDNAEMDHTASDGCIILSREARDSIQASRDRSLRVVE